uniref:Uncharacterized protein n=1 Tax=Rhizophora mucronata TaxID=61149 RepID=A0A2P2QCE7_RHIMU
MRSMNVTLHISHSHLQWNIFLANWPISFVFCFSRAR